MPGDKNKTSSEAPFAQAMGQAKHAAEEFTRMVAQMKFPALPDATALLGAHQRNMEALSAANRITMEGAQTVAKRHMEIIQQTMAEMTETMQALARNYPFIRCLALSLHEDEYHILRMMEKGARGYLSKKINAEDLIVC